MTIENLFLLCVAVAAFCAALLAINGVAVAFSRFMTRFRSNQ